MGSNPTGRVFFSECGAIGSASVLGIEGCMFDSYHSEVFKLYFMFSKNKIKNLIRKRKKKKIKRLALKGNPQVKGVCLKVFEKKPKKPNSALR